MKKRLIIIAIQDENLISLKIQLEHILGDFIEIKGQTLKDLKFGFIQSDDVVLLSAEALKGLVAPFLPEDCTYIASSRDVNIVNLKELIGLPPGQNILVVNDHYTETMETVKSLKQVLFEHSYYPYLQGQPLPEKIDYVVTPGERHLVPAALGEIIDIGPRILSFDTINQITPYFHIEINPSVLMNRYIKSLVSTSKRVKNTITYYENQNQHRLFEEIRTNNNAMRETIDIARKVAKTTRCIHVEGETGSGRKMFAEMIHNESAYRNGKLLTYNCSDKTEELLDAELFGKEEGNHVVQGIIEAANDGSLFIKNIECLSELLQGKLLSLLESNEIQRVNSTISVTVNVRLITSTTENLLSLMEQQKIRTDLYSYISSYIVSVPALSLRKEDLPILIADYKKQLKREDITFSEEVLEVFKLYNWPGNVRELFNVISYCACLEFSKIELTSLPLYFRAGYKEHSKSDIDFKPIIKKIEEHGFLTESLAILAIFKKGKEQHQAYGRTKVKQFLEQINIHLTDQQLRLRIDVLNELGLINVRQGRAGTTISNKGEYFLENY
ncbi:sigma 54-interacting transcriptional regulator [Bacillus sp. DTU_2020_1000418_1_SI_GHA_SEK_038]|uniref:sigma 54-interacting transcriptional regulator n=1 Tax=Bacillus sp. DTU_2020_1000418_1_SI_GHA_SEK_038 TaxID=3077585 RepID=UPI0028EC4FFE|nr:sigma 54-interacting transcriptional regulator [Bacillus sp. DTU_2020_1000418_1_SI_GHA_SEK_038]WNS75782.1 sigma 54-interacting transcriptional regulator [Bacillus sp. DTU_2020_1000418_1_SI_GHA_SEK_038]